jgi:hypothetical protein
MRFDPLQVILLQKPTDVWLARKKGNLVFLEEAPLVECHLSARVEALDHAPDDTSDPLAAYNTRDLLDG